MYNPFYPPYYYQQQTQNAQSIPLQTGGSFYFVNSQKEVEDWIVGAGQTVFFFDRNSSVFYIKSVAQNGLSQPIEVYDYTQRASQQGSEAYAGAFDVNLDNYITRDEFTQFEAKIKALLDKEDEEDE